jgi:hypothetical protein
MPFRAGVADAGILGWFAIVAASPEFECPLVSVELITDPGCNQARLIFSAGVN